MSAVDAQGNIHDRTGQFAEKRNPAPSAGLASGADQDRRFGDAYYAAHARLAEAQEVLRREATRAIRSQIPEAAEAAEFDCEGDGQLSFAYFADAGGRTVEGSPEQVAAMLELASHFDAAELTADSHDGRWSVSRVDPSPLTGLAGAKQRLAEAQDRYQHAGPDRKYQADRDIHEAAIEVMRETIAESGAPIAEVRLSWGDQGGDYLVTEYVVDTSGGEHGMWNDQWGIFDDLDEAAAVIDAPSTHLAGDGTMPLRSSPSGDYFTLKIGVQQ